MWLKPRASHMLVKHFATELHSESNISPLLRLKMENPLHWDFQITTFVQRTSKIHSLSTIVILNDQAVNLDWDANSQTLPQEILDQVQECFLRISLW